MKKLTNPRSLLHLYRALTIVIFLLSLSYVSLANNISVSNSKLSGQNASTNLVKIEFSISWENSFRVSTGPANWDAAWVFVKYRVATASGGDGLWRHVNLLATGNVTGSGSILKVTPEGALLYRSTNGSGTFTVNGSALSWNYGTHVESGTTDYIDDDDAIEIKVFAVEMVYVTVGAFNVGGGGGGANTAFTSTNITTANASLIGTGYPTGGTNSNASFPNGFNAFYCMKYEISQQQYVDFLNTLTSVQQSKHVSSSLSNPAGSPALFSLFLGGGYTGVNFSRNGIDIQIPSNGANPAVFGCNLDGDAVFSEENDGQWIACNYLHYRDWTAYLDWSGLRPMTELEYEKACRGNQPSVLNEYAWGTNANSRAEGASNGGTLNETPSNLGANVNFGGNPTVGGPLRVGSFATATSSRAIAGATYFGIMEMTGNVEDPVAYAGSNPTYTGIHGNGEIDASGFSDVNLWPAQNTSSLKKGVIHRGGTWDRPLIGVSERTSEVDILYDNRYANIGGRGVRTAP